MVDSWFFILATIAILLIPGPTNALLASSAYQKGIAKTSRFIPAELFGYLYAISFWALFIHLTAPIWPNLIHILQFMSTVYVVWLAVSLWKSTSITQYSQTHCSVRPAQWFFSTFKNPKALLFAVGVFPVSAWDDVLNFFAVFGIFALILIPSSIFWMYWGQSLLAKKQVPQRKADLFNKGSAMLLLLCMLPLVIQFFKSV